MYIYLCVCVCLYTVGKNCQMQHPEYVTCLVELLKCTFDVRYLNNNSEQEIAHMGYKTKTLVGIDYQSQLLLLLTFYSLRVFHIS